MVNALAGSGQGQLTGPHGVATDNDNGVKYVYVSDIANNKVYKFSDTGAYVTSWGSSGPQKFNGPHGVAVDNEHSVYVTDKGNNRVEKFDKSGNFLKEFGKPVHAMSWRSI